MGWSAGYDDDWKRDIGYGVPAYCDHPGCGEEIDRGLSFVCGGQPYGGDHGCGLYFCSKHRRYAGDRRDNEQLCACCYPNRGKRFAPTPDHPDWLRWKLTDESWQQWRDEHPAEVEAMREAVEPIPYTLTDAGRALLEGKAGGA